MTEDEVKKKMMVRRSKTSQESSDIEESKSPISMSKSPIMNGRRPVISLNIGSEYLAKENGSIEELKTPTTIRR